VREAVLQELREHFKPEFLNRIDDICVFHQLSREQIVKIIDVQLERLRKMLGEKVFNSSWMIRRSQLLARPSDMTQITGRGHSSGQFKLCHLQKPAGGEQSFERRCFARASRKSVGQAIRWFLKRGGGPQSRNVCRTRFQTRGEKGKMSQWNPLHTWDFAGSHEHVCCRCNTAARDGPDQNDEMERLTGTRLRTL